MTLGLQMGDFSNSIIPFVGLPTVELNGPLLFVLYEYVTIFIYG